jgi:selenide,water dikinase
MVEASGAGVRIRARQLPLLPGALVLAEQGHWSGGMKRNRGYLEGKGNLVIDSGLTAPLVGLLFESETSGGLLFSVSLDYADKVLERFEAKGESCWEIGEVIAEPQIHIV